MIISAASRVPEKPPGRQNGSPEWGLSFCYRRSRSDHLHPVLRDIYPDSPFVSYAQTALRVSAYGRSAYRNFMYQSFLKCMIGSKTAVSSVSSSFFHATTNRTSPPHGRYPRAESFSSSAIRTFDILATFTARPSIFAYRKQSFTKSGAPLCSLSMISFLSLKKSSTTSLCVSCRAISFGSGYCISSTIYSTPGTLKQSNIPLLQ